MTNIERAVAMQRIAEEEMDGFTTNGFNRKVWNPDGSIFAEVLYWYETNPCADSATANNGGGYSNPEICVKVGNDLWAIEDTSCGDFGSRICVSCINPDVEALAFDYGQEGSRQAYYGTMLDEGQDFTEFTSRDNDALDTVCQLLNWTYTLSGAKENEHEKEYIYTLEAE